MESLGDFLDGPMGCSHTASCTGVVVCEPIDQYDLFKDGCDVDGPGVERWRERPNSFAYLVRF
jgi:hypothetical protein